jgi:hypothetical protein
LICHSQCVTFTAEDVVERLTDAGVRLDRGLTDADLKRIEKKYAFTFGPDQRALLRAALPLGDAWLNWRHATAANIRERLQRPIEFVVGAVHKRDFWPHSWGPRPTESAAAEKTARAQLATVPALLPVFGHRYLPAAPAPAGSPVFALADDVRIYADDLLAYAGLEFGFAGATAAASAERELVPVPFWSDLARGASNADL